MRLLFLLQVLLLLGVPLHHLLRLLLVLLLHLLRSFWRSFLLRQLLMFVLLPLLEFVAFLILSGYQLILLLLVPLVCLRIAGMRSAGAFDGREFVGMDGISAALRHTSTVSGSVGSSSFSGCDNAAAAEFSRPRAGCDRGPAHVR